jgi:hypothetical protein
MASTHVRVKTAYLAASLPTRDARLFIGVTGEGFMKGDHREALVS